MYSYGLPHIAEQKQDDQLEHTYSSDVRIRDVALRTCQRRWTIRRSGERGSGLPVLAAWHNDDDDDDIYDICYNIDMCLYIYLSIYIYIYIYIKHTWFSLVGFYGIPTIVGYLMPTHVFTDICMISFEIYFVDNVFKRAQANSFFMHSQMV